VPIGCIVKGLRGDVKVASAAWQYFFVMHNPAW
jgi:hypothetical protein